MNLFLGFDPSFQKQKMNKNLQCGLHVIDSKAIGFPEHNKGQLWDNFGNSGK